MTSWQRIQYLKFGDVVTFDTTFKTNRFGFPLGCLVGVDNWGRTICFAMCFIARETADNFEWVFDKLLEATTRKPPLVIFTDEDQGMSLAISNVLPSAKHRLCAWHLERNLRKKLLGALGVEKYKPIRSTFWHLVKNDFGENHFDAKFQELSEIYKDHTEVGQALAHLEKLKLKWGKCFSKGLFCFDQSSTSRVESINSVIKRNKMSNVRTIAELTKLLDALFNDYLKQEQEMREAEAKSTKIKLKFTGFPFCRRYPAQLTPFAYSKMEDQLGVASNNLGNYKCSEFNEDTDVVEVFYSLEGPVEHITYRVTVRKATPADYAEGAPISSKIVPIPLDCTCSWRENWKLPCRHMFCVACKHSSPILPPEIFSDRWKWNSSSNLEHYAALSFDPYTENEMDSSGSSQDMLRRKTFTNLMGYCRSIASNAVSSGYDKEFQQCLQSFQSILSARQGGTSSNEGPGMYSNNPPVTQAKRGRKRTLESG